MPVLKSSEMTKLARDGYTAQGKPNPYVRLCPEWLLYAFGQMMDASGRPLPRDASVKRGYVVQSGDLVFKFDKKSDIFERVS